MIEYNTKNWFLVIFSMHRSHVFKTLLPTVAMMGFYTFICVYFSGFIVSNLKGTTIVHSLLGIVLGLLLVFRTNTAYDRWWEGRKLWGSLVNESRNMAIKLNSYISRDETEKRTKFINLISGFCASLKDHLRGEADYNDFRELKLPAGKSHLPNTVAALLGSEIADLYKQEVISGEQLLVLDRHISMLTDITGACERIKNTPIPYSYNMHLKKYIFFYVITLPWGLMTDLKYLSVAAVMLVFYAMVGIELIAEEIEDPFGYDSDDLPLEKICQTISTNVREIMA